MAPSPALRRVLNGLSSSPSTLGSRFCSLRHNSTLTTPKLFVSGIRASNQWVFEILFPPHHKLNKLVSEPGLSRLTTDEKLKEAFSPFGQLFEAKVITDRVSGRSKGFGFVRYASIEEAEKAREGMNAKFLDGWVIFVDPAKPREPKPRPTPEPEASESGFRTNKTIGWCG